MGDAVANALGSVEPLREALEARVAPRGKLTLLEALEWIRVGSESPGETRTRLVLVRAGLPEPELNKPVYGPGRLWLGRPDMRWKKQRVLLEYQGREFHDSDEQRAQDEVRFARFCDHDWAVVPVWNDHINTDQPRIDLVLEVADKLGHPPASLDLNAIHPRFFSTRMLELAEIRARRLRARGRLTGPADGLLFRSEEGATAYARLGGRNALSIEDVPGIREVGRTECSLDRGGGTDALSDGSWQLVAIARVGRGCDDSMEQRPTDHERPHHAAPPGHLHPRDQAPRRHLVVPARRDSAGRDAGWFRDALPRPARDGRAGQLQRHRRRRRGARLLRRRLVPDAPSGCRAAGTAQRIVLHFESATHRATVWVGDDRGRLPRGRLHPVRGRRHRARPAGRGGAVTRRASTTR